MTGGLQFYPSTQFIGSIYTGKISGSAVKILPKGSGWLMGAHRGYKTEEAVSRSTETASDTAYIHWVGSACVIVFLLFWFA